MSRISVYTYEPLIIGFQFLASPSYRFSERFAWFILTAAGKGKNSNIAPIEWLGLMVGSGIVITAFMTDYLKHMLRTFAPGELLRAGDPRIMEVAQQYVPESFPWLLFTVGTLVILASAIRFRSRV